jgi:hypothetical protein
MTDQTELKAEVKKIVLDLGDKEIDLAPYQAKMLANILGELFSNKIQMPPQPYPVFVERPFFWPYPYDYVWCAPSGGTVYIEPQPRTVTLSFIPEPALDRLPENVSGDICNADL